MLWWLVSCIVLGYAWGEKKTTADIAGYLAWCIILGIFFILLGSIA